MKNSPRKFFARLAFGLLLSAGLSARAATLTVLNLNDNGAGSLRQAIGNSSQGDTIVFNSSLVGTITLTNGQLVIANNYLTISGPGPSILSISGNNSNRVFYISPNSISIISGLTITQGLDRGTNGSNLSYYCTNDTFVSYPAPIFPTSGGTGHGGGLLNWGDLTISNCVFLNNSALGGDGGNGLLIGALCDNVRSPLVSYGTNGGWGFGGAIENNGSLATFGCSFVNNMAIGGGGGGASDASATGGTGGAATAGAVFDATGFWSSISCCFASNSATGGVGGVGAHSTYNGGRGGDGGGATSGAIYAAESLLQNCTLFANTALGGSGGSGGSTEGGTLGHGGTGGTGGMATGGAVYDYNSKIYSCTIVNNGVLRGVGGTGGLNWYYSNFNGTNGDFGLMFGGGIYCYGALTHFQNTIIAGNSCPSFNVQDGIDVFSYPYSVTSYGFNLIGITNGSSGWVSSDLTGNSDYPLNPKLGPLQANGGPTYTMALLTNSPAIDKGTNNSGSLDQRGYPRPLDIPWIANAIGGDGSDIGAYETTWSLDIGLRVVDGTITKEIAGEYPVVSPLRIRKNGANYGILLVATNSASASKFHIQTSSGVKALQILP